MIPDTTLAGRRVIIGLSGGVDSAVAAFLLKRQGAAVEALHMTNWDDEDGYCTAADDLQDARHVCDQLEIPLHHANFSNDYRESVFEHFLSEYAAGRTPNPDVLCNREIKFGVFRRYAQRLGADLIATGHYARVVREGDVTVLVKARDVGKDQTYFLHAVPQQALADTVFPLGELQKHRGPRTGARGRPARPRQKGFDGDLLHRRATFSRVFVAISTRQSGPDAGRGWRRSR